jgi:hypothetical protein
MMLQNNITFRNINYAISNLYANGNDVTIDEDVTAPFSILGHRIFAGAAYDSSMPTKADLATTSLDIHGSGNYTIYGSGAVGTTLDADVAITTGEQTSGKVARAIWNSAVNGTVVLNGDAVTDDKQREV